MKVNHRIHFQAHTAETLKDRQQNTIFLFQFMTPCIIVALAQRMFGRFLTLLAALVFGALLVLAVDVVGIVH